MSHKFSVRHAMGGAQKNRIIQPSVYNVYILTLCYVFVWFFMLQTTTTWPRRPSHRFRIQDMQMNHSSFVAYTLIKKKIKFSSYIRKFRQERLQILQKSYMTNALLKYD